MGPFATTTFASAQRRYDNMEDPGWAEPDNDPEPVELIDDEENDDEPTDE